MLLGQGVRSLSCGEIEVRVHPALLSKDSLMVSVRGEFDALLVEGDVVGRTMYCGKGAGKQPTASAIISDLVDIGKNMPFGSPVRTKPFVYVNDCTIKLIDDIESCYYIRFMALDIPGVLGHLSSILGRHQTSIASVIQKAQQRGKHVPLVIMTHEAIEHDIKNTLAEIDNLDCMKEKSALIRIA